MRQRKLRLFYIPNIDLWRWERQSNTFLLIQLSRSRESLVQTQRALEGLDRRSDELGTFVRENWSNARSDFREVVETEASEIKRERKHILQAQDRLVVVIDYIKSELKLRKVNIDSKLPSFYASATDT